MDALGVRIGNEWDTDSEVPGNGSAFGEDISIGDKTIYRLREGIERFFITDINNPAASAQAQSTVPVLWDTIWTPSNGDASYFSHIPGGGNVLYMDGHVKFLRYPSKWPVSAAMPQLMDQFG